MRKTLFLLSAVILAMQTSFSQNPIDVTESTLKVPALMEETFYYGFAEGDRLIFNFEEVNGKELKELEITELPSSSKFMEYKTKKIENKSLQISRTGIYKFRFSNTALGGRICRIKIQRIPSSEITKNFNTTVYWRTLYDTAYVPRQERFLERTDTVVTNLVDQIAKVSSTSSLNGNPNKNIVDFSLPLNTISWSYYIGVGNEGKKAYESGKDKFISSAAATVSEIPGYGPMAALALTGINVFSKVQGSDNVRYYFITDWENALLFMAGQGFMQYKQGDVINDASQMKGPLVGKVYLGLLNDNIMDPIEVVVQITSIQVTQTFGTRTVIDKKVTSIQEAYLNK